MAEVQDISDIQAILVWMGLVSFKYKSGPIVTLVLDLSIDLSIDPSPTIAS